MPAHTRRWLFAALPAALLIALIALVVAGLWTSAFSPVPLLDAGPVSRWGLPAATAVGELAGAVTLGAVFLAAAVLSSGTATRAALMTAGVAGSVWTVAAVVRLLFNASVAMGTPLNAPGFGAGIELFATRVEGGRSLLIVPVLVCLAATVALGSTTATGAAWAGALSLAALGVQASAGHSASAGNHMLAISALFLHLTGAALWIGSLAALGILWLSGRLAATAVPDAVRRFSSMAGWAYVLVALSGVVTAILRLGGWSGLGTRYGVLVLVKVALFGVLGVFGLVHRRRVITSLTTVRSAAFWRLAAVEILVMGAVSGVAVALASSAPPSDGVLTGPVTAARLVTGLNLPPQPSLARYFTTWNPDFLFACVSIAGLYVYLRWVRRLRRRGDDWPWGRTVSWCVGLVVFAWVTSGGPALYGHILFSSHMLQHMLLAMVVPLFVVSGAPVTLALRALPARKDGSRGPREWLLTIVHSRWGTFFANPIVAAVNFAGSMVVFYYTPAFEYALRTEIGHAAMVVHFSLAGYLFANALIGIDPGPARPGYPQRLLLLLSTMAFHAFFGVSLMSSDTLLVANWFGLLGRPWGGSAIADQQAGGEIAWGLGEVPTIVLAIIVAVRWSAADGRDARRKDRQADRDGDAELQDYNAMLSGLSERDRA